MRKGGEEKNVSTRREARLYRKEMARKIAPYSKREKRWKKGGGVTVCLRWRASQRPRGKASARKKGTVRHVTGREVRRRKKVDESKATPGRTPSTKVGGRRKIVLGKVLGKKKKSRRSQRKNPEILIAKKSAPFSWGGDARKREKADFKE